MFEYCEYNPFTLTGRPSNHFNQINYAALTNEQKQRFISRYKNGLLVEIDLSGFHLYLLYLILGLEFPKNIYEHLQRFYPEGVNPKDYTFKQIYGGIDKELLEITPFKEITQLQRQVWKQYQDGTLKTFLFDRKVQLPDLTSHKVFNYLLQNLETEFNSTLLEQLLKVLDGKETKLILYTYDSFLFDYSPNDGLQIIKTLVDVFETIPIHLKVGHSYNDLKPIKLNS